MRVSAVTTTKISMSCATRGIRAAPKVRVSDSCTRRCTTAYSGPRLRPYRWTQPRQGLRAKLRRQDEHQLRREWLFRCELIDGHNP